MVLFSSNWLILFPIAFSLFVALRLSLGTVRAQGRSWMLLAVSSLILLMFWFSLLAVGGRAHWISIAWLMILAMFSVVIFWKRRRMERKAMLLSCLSATDLPQQQALAGYFLQENVGWPRRKAGALQRDLAQGVPWELALEMRGIAVGVYERLAIRLRYAFGISCPNELESSTSHSPLSIEAEFERLLGRLLIFAWVVVIIPILYLIAVFIMPTFQSMFEEMGVELPRMSQLVLGIGDWTSSTRNSQLFALLPMLMLILFAVVFLLWLFPSLLQLPMFRYISGDYYTNAGLFALAQISESEPDLIAACRRTSEIVPVAYIARRFQLAADYLEQGLPLATALQKSGILKREEIRRMQGHTIFTGDLQRPNERNVVWALQQLAASRIEQMLNRYSMLTQGAVVGLTLMLALLIGFVVVGMIMALTHLISSLA